MMIIFDRHYSDESLVDIDEDIRWALEKDFAEIPKDEHGFRQGEFRVTITWSNEDV
jgi:hypothetical protein